MREPELAIAASPREWAQRLHRHVADHGGARVRVTALQRRDVLDEAVDVLVADDSTSFLTAQLVAELHALGGCEIHANLRLLSQVGRSAHVLETSEGPN